MMRCKGGDMQWDGMRLEPASCTKLIYDKTELDELQRDAIGWDWMHKYVK